MYIIKGYAQDFYMGQTDNGRQVLMGLLCLGVIAYFFRAGKAKSAITSRR